MKNFALWLKLGILIFAALGVMSFLGGHFYYAWRVSQANDRLLEATKNLSGTSPPEYIKSLADKRSEKDHDQQYEDQCFNIFTHVAGIFGGLAFSALIDLTGLSAATSAMAHTTQASAATTESQNG
jgi:predicted membrane channel-forming protein YqfA (hemolysin III family)